MPSKSNERVVLGRLYDLASFVSIVEGESPDFVLQYDSSSRPFGVEVTALYASQTDARMINVPHYARDLLSGGAPIHKDDRQAMPQTLQLRRGGKSPPEPISGIVLRVPSHREWLDDLSAAIARKERRYSEYISNLSHVSIIIDDTTGVFGVEDLRAPPPILQAPELVALVGASRFREIYLMLAHKGGAGVVGLKMQTLVAQTHLIGWAIAADPQAPKVVSEVLPIIAFIMRLRGVQVDLVESGDGVELLLGGCSLTFGEKGIVVRDHRDSDLPAYEPVALPPRLDPGLVERCQTFCSQKQFVGGLLEPVPGRAGQVLPIPPPQS